MGVYGKMAEILCHNERGDGEMIFGAFDDLIDSLYLSPAEYADAAQRLALEENAKRLLKEYPYLVGMQSQKQGYMRVTPLIAALMIDSHRCSPELFSLLTAVPCDLNTAKDCGRTALHFLALHNHVPFLRQLLSNDRQTINVNATTKAEHCTPVHMAALKGCHQALAVLSVQGKADVNICNSFKQSPLHVACFFGQTKSRVLNPNLTKELAHQYLASIRILLASGALVNVCDALNKTPLYYLSEVVFPP